MFADDLHVDRTTIEQALAQVRSWLRQAFARPDAYHGPEHAEEVLRLASSIAQRVPARLTLAEELILSVAALLHDVGYTAYRPEWAPNRREHVPASIAFAQRQLAQISPLAEYPRLIAAVSVLIAYHDDTSYKFPSFVWEGRVGSIDLGPYATQLAAFETSLSPTQRERLRLLLAILREADALTAAGSAGAERSFQYALHRDLPMFACGNPLNAWCWEESAAGNTRLAAKRALIDAFTSEGRRAAWEGYRATEAYLQGICEEHGVPYEPETIAAAAANESPAVGTIGGTEPTFELISYAGWDTPRRTPRNSTLVDASAMRPYASANATMRRLPLDLLPDAPQSAEREAQPMMALASLHTHLLSEYALSLFDLTGIIAYRLDGITARVLPPFVERSVGMVAAGMDVLAIRNGAATITLARELGAPMLWVARVTDPPDSS